MLRQKSFEKQTPTLYLVATPIGNLDELTPRAIEILSNVDVIAAEDTRNTLKLLTHFNIKNRLIAHHLHNEENSCRGILDLLRENKNVALVSDAGYPLINDPGQTLVKMVTEEGFCVVPVSGASAFIDALVASGLETEQFMYIGFLPVGDKEFREKVNEIKEYRHTIIFYEAPHRIEKTLKKLLELLGNRNICLAREITKIHEEFIRGTMEEVLSVVDELKGEMVLVVEGNKEEKKELSVFKLNEMVNREIEAGLSASQAIRRVAEMTGVKKNQVYSGYYNSDV